MRNLSVMTAAVFMTGGVYADNGKDLNLQEVKKMMNQQKQEVRFLENKGQMMDMNGKPVPFVLFKAESPRLNVWITEKGITYQTIKIEEEKERESKNENEAHFINGEEEEVKIYWERIDMELKGANIKRENIIAEGAEQGHFNYFYPHCPDGIYGVKAYKKITIKEVYPGIDWVLYNSSERGMKYDFVVHPGGDYKQIQLVYKSKKPLKINKKGEVEIKTHYGDIKENRPISFYEGKEVKTRFKQVYQKPILIHGDRGYETGIEVGVADIGRINADLIIDPQLYWATYLGTNDFDGPISIDADANGNVFVAGYTNSTNNFPVQNAGTFFQGTKAGGGNDVFIMKFDNAGNLLWATYYGGNGNEFATSLKSDGSGNVFVTGNTNSTNFPVQNAGTFFQGALAGVADAFILKFDNAGNRLWATYYGSSVSDFGYSISTDGNGNVFVTGYTNSTNFPVQNAGTFFQGTSGGLYDAFILKFDNAGNRLWATYYGGSSDDYGFSLTTDGSGNVFVIGYTNSTNFPVQNAGTFFQGMLGGLFDVFILKFDNAGNRLWATYYGGSSDDYGFSLTTDGSGNVFVTGYTNSTNFPVQNAGTFFQGTSGGLYDAFILKFDNAGNRLWATYYGGSGYESFASYANLAVDGCGNVYMSFRTSSIVLPFQNSCDAQYFDNTFNGGSTDMFLVLFSNSGTLLWTSYIGGDGNDFKGALASDSNNNLFMVGEWVNVTSNASYPLTNPGGGAYFDGTFNGADDGYILKFCSSSCICSPYYGCIVGVCPSTTDTINIGICQGDSIFVGNGWQTASGTYYDTLVNACGSDSIIITILTIHPLPSVTVGTNSPVCEGKTLQLSAAGGTSYSWTGPNGFATTQQNPVIDNVSQGAAGTYYAMVSNGGCTAMDSIEVTINPSPEITLKHDNDTCDKGKGRIQALVSGGTEPYQYQWNTGSVGSEIGNLHGGYYYVVVTDANGCSRMDSVTIVNWSEDCSYFVYVPGAFSPNGDGRNDVLHVKGEGVVWIQFEIYNRWGNKVFESNDLSMGWDGTYKGQMQNTGVFVYILEAEFENGERIKKSGDITLLR